MAFKLFVLAIMVAGASKPVVRESRLVQMIVKSDGSASRRGNSVGEHKLDPQMASFIGQLREMDENDDVANDDDTVDGPGGVQTTALGVKQAQARAAENPSVVGQNPKHSGIHMPDSCDPRVNLPVCEMRTSDGDLCVTKEGQVLLGEIVGQNGWSTVQEVLAAFTTQHWLDARKIWMDLDGNLFVRIKSMSSHKGGSVCFTQAGLDAIGDWVGRNGWSTIEEVVAAFTTEAWLKSSESWCKRCIVDCRESWMIQCNDQYKVDWR